MIVTVIIPLTTTLILILILILILFLLLFILLPLLLPLPPLSQFLLIPLPHFLQFHPSIIFLRPLKTNPITLTITHPRIRTKHRRTIKNPLPKILKNSPTHIIRQRRLQNPIPKMSILFSRHRADASGRHSKLGTTRLREHARHV